MYIDSTNYCSQAFLGPFRVKKKSTKTGGANVNSQDIDFEDSDEDITVVRRVRSRLAALEVEEDEEDMEFIEDVDNTHQALLDEEVASMNLDTIMDLGNMTSRQSQEAMFMLSKVSFIIICLISIFILFTSGNWSCQAGSPFRPASNSF